MASRRYTAEQVDAAVQALGDAARFGHAHEIVTHAALKPELSERRWLNYLGDDQAEDAIRGAYGPNYDRLREVKRRYDPDNVFHLNHNIAP